jgi:membrane-anchored mycosin MYCP
MPPTAWPVRATVAGALAAAAATAALAPLIALAAPGTASELTSAGGPLASASTGAAGTRARLASSDCVGPNHAVRAKAPWAEQQLRPSAVWDMTQGAGQIVAVLDSGVSAAAPALAGAVLPGLDVATGKSADTDCAAHGTFVAGIIAARPTTGSGFTGLAPRARILPVNVINANGDATSAAVATGISYAVAHGATIIDVSPAVTPGPSAELRAAVAAAEARNVVVIAPVNADGTSTSNQVSFPAAYPGVVAVTATSSSGAADVGGSGGVAVSLAAPGSEVTSIGPLGPGEVTASGPALATGFVAGTAALVRSYYPQLSAAQVVQRMEATANPPGDTLPDPEVGYGIVAPYTAVTTVLQEKSGNSAPASSAIHLPPLQQPDTWPSTAIVLVCSAVFVSVVGAAAGGYIIRQGRRRKWAAPPVTSARHHAPRASAPAGQPDSRP